jgi:hypothetical protein
MMSSLGRLQRARNLGIRGRKKAGNLLGQRLVGGKASELALPEIEIAPSHALEIGCVVTVGGHAADYSSLAGANAAFAGAKRALSHCGIGAKVTGPM